MPNEEKNGRAVGIPGKTAMNSRLSSLETAVELAACGMECFSVDKNLPKWKIVDINDHSLQSKRHNQCCDGNPISLQWTFAFLVSFSLKTAANGAIFHSKAHNPETHVNNASLSSRVKIQNKTNRNESLGIGRSCMETFAGKRGIIHSRMLPNLNTLNHNDKW